MTVSFISGQAADEKLFEHLSLPPHIEKKYVQWIEPLRRETLVSYAKRISQQIDQANPFALVGVSFGGIMAIELNKILQPATTIIISSIASKQEHPPHFRLFNFFKMQKIVPAIFYKSYSPFVNWYFGAKTKREIELLRYYMKKATKNYMKWATNEILNWSNEIKPPNLFHIHGTADRIFLHQYTHADIKIKGGTHLMVHNRADEISKILTERFNSIPS